MEPVYALPRTASVHLSAFDPKPHHRTYSFRLGISSTRTHAVGSWAAHFPPTDLPWWPRSHASPKNALAGTQSTPSEPRCLRKRVRNWRVSRNGRSSPLRISLWFQPSAVSFLPSCAFTWAIFPAMGNLKLASTLCYVAYRSSDTWHGLQRWLPMADTWSYHRLLSAFRSYRTPTGAISWMDPENHATVDGWCWGVQRWKQGCQMGCWSSSTSLC
jgi:hypothetical protein